MSKLTIYKASAGSGKTYRLVLEYLKLLLVNPMNYRHILAVTFTNKATAEMKERVLRDLYKVAKGKSAGLLQSLAEETGLSERKIEENAQQALSLILHNYDHFSISTIDSFFQRVLRSFAREAGLYGTYEIMLDQQAVMDEACDRLLLDVENDAELRKWLTAMSEDRLEAGKNWQINEQILSLGKELYNEAFQPYLLQHEGIEAERNRIRALKKTLSKTKKHFENEMQSKGQRGLKMIEGFGLVLSDFKGGSRSFINHLTYWAEKRKDKFEPSATFLKAIDDPEQWAVAKSPKREAIQAAYHQGLNELLKSAVDFIHQNIASYITAIELLRYLHTLGVLTTLLSKIREIGQERNAMLLSEGNALLRGIIGNNDAPFVYEKTGSYYHHFMIDEFQDTSVSQWDNFKPLLGNSLAQGYNNLVVGDVKQSIYRWRNSDWQLLNQQIKEDLKVFTPREVLLNGNWRSAENLVHFNNRFFALASKLLQQSYNAAISEAEIAETEQFKQTIELAYHDVEQQVKSALPGGLVQCTFLDEKEYGNIVLQKVIETVKYVQDQGYQARDVVVLVRRNEEGRKVAEALLKAKKEAGSYNFEVISDDSLFLETSAAVRMLVQFFNYLLQPYDAIARANVVHEFEAFLLPQLSKIGKLPGLFSAQDQISFDFERASNSGSHFLSAQIIADYFPFFNQPELKFQVQQWTHHSLIDLTDELIERYKLNHLSGEQANLQAFKDVVNDFSRREGGNLRQFVDWWNQFGAKIKLQTAGDRDAIQIMTIHKSKGLEFPVVIIPFANWSFVPTNQKDNILWCSTIDTPYTDFPVLPLKNTKALSRSHFAYHHYFEMLLTYIDNLNLLYVAQTRAVEGLFVFAGNKQGEPKTVSELLLKLLSGTDEPAFPREIEEGVFRLGDLNRKEGRRESATTGVDLTGRVNVQRNLSQTLKLKQNFVDFLEPGNNSRSARINRGKLIHELFSYIETIDEVDAALDKMQKDGKVDRDEIGPLRLEIDQLLSQTMALEWFGGSYRVMNERTIILPGFNLQRPDRIMMGKGKVVVLDYKVSDTLQSSHRRQVKQYCISLREMGYENVEGWLWYLKSNQIVDAYRDE